MEDNENKTIDQQIEEAALRNAQLQEISNSILQTGVQSKAGVYPSFYRAREKRIAESSEFANQKEFDYTEFSNYMISHKATDERGIASEDVLNNPSVRNKLYSLADMFEQRGYDIKDVNYMMSRPNTSFSDKELYAKYIKLLSNDTSLKECKDYFDLINTAKNFTTIFQRYNHEDNTEISFIVDSGTTNDGLLNYWKPQLKSMGIEYEPTSDKYGKATIPINMLASAPYFAYAFIESYDNDYSNVENNYDEVKGNSDKQFIKEDSGIFLGGNDRSQLISINNVTNDRDGGTWRYARNPVEYWADFMSGSGTWGGWQGDEEIYKFINSKNISYDELENQAGISVSDYQKERSTLSKKYLDVNIIDVMRPVHDIIKDTIQKLGLPQEEAVSTTTLPTITLEEGEIKDAQNKKELESGQVTPLNQIMKEIPNLLATRELTPDMNITYHSLRDSKTSAYTPLDPSKYEKLQQDLQKALNHGRVKVHGTIVNAAADDIDNMYITVDFEVSSEDKDDKSTILGEYIKGGFKSSSVKPGTDAISVRIPASIFGGPSTDAVNSPVVKYRNQIDYLRKNGYGGQITLLEDFLPESLPLRIEFDGDENVAVKLKFGTYNQESEFKEEHEIKIYEDQYNNLAKTIYLMKGLKSKLYIARFLKDAYGEKSEYFLKAKDEFETQYGQAMATLATTIFKKEYDNGEPIWDLIMDTKYNLGLTDSEGVDLDLFDTARVRKYEQNKRNKKK